MVTTKSTNRALTKRPKPSPRDKSGLEPDDGGLCDMSRPAVFLDRDGTLIEDREYLSDPAGVRLLPGVPEGLRRLREAGFALVVVTNQSGIGRGWMTEEDYRQVAAELDRQLAEHGAWLDGAFFCAAAPAAHPNLEHAD